MTGGKWRSVSVYAPLVKKIEKLIDNEVILYSNPNQFINAIVERAVQDFIEKIQNSE